MNARECLEQLGSSRLSFEEAAHFFSSRVPRLFVLYQVSEAGKKPLLAKGNHPGSKYVAAFTDAAAAGKVEVDHPERMKLLEEPALPFLIKACRSEADGVVFNPGLPSLAFISRQQLLGLVREYAVEQLAAMPGPWVPTQDGHLLLVEYEPERYTVAVYTSEADAGYVAQKSGGQVVRHPWSVIFQRCRELGAEAPYLHFGLPEQMPLAPRHAEKIMRGPHYGMQEEVRTEHRFTPHSGKEPDLAGREMPKQVAADAFPGRRAAAAPVPEWERDSERKAAAGRNPAGRPESAVRKPVDPDVEAGLKKLEKATLEGQGMGNGWEVSRAMAELRRIWVVVDPDGNMVILAGQDQSPIVDFFTSEAHAWRLIEEARRKNPSLPAMTPRLISTKKLYRALAPRRPIVWINRGSEEAWTSITGHTLPYVLELKEQMEQGTAQKP